MDGIAFVFDSGPYRGWEKTHDYAVLVKSHRLPTVVVESGWSETYCGLFEDINRILVGGNGKINIAFLLKWRKRSNNCVSGIIEVYKCDHANIPRLIQQEVCSRQDI